MQLPISNPVKIRTIKKGPMKVIDRHENTYKVLDLANHGARELVASLLSTLMR
jgi:hypothetical protein